MATKRRIHTPAALTGIHLNDEVNLTPQNTFVNIENILKSDLPLDEAAERIHDAQLLETDILTRKDSLDRFLDYCYFKAKTGYDHIIHLAYPSKRIGDDEIERKARSYRVSNCRWLACAASATSRAWPRLSPRRPAR